jgi:hypothetical protein
MMAEKFTSDVSVEGDNNGGRSEPPFFQHWWMTDEIHHEV